ncbi:hypothetical protein R3P38DRAFT_3245954 [Favolaschia claudopus]|uniref:Uncharacterized protein n=1 Tax=Favolaschia claudopus TaxID=2862362 RepID=A0AAV9YZT9_9AGAR
MGPTPTALGVAAAYLLSTSSSAKRADPASALANLAVLGLAPRARSTEFAVLLGMYSTYISSVSLSACGYRPLAADSPVRDRGLFSSSLFLTTLSASARAHLLPALLSLILVTIGVQYFLYVRSAVRDRNTRWVRRRPRSASRLHTCYLPRPLRSEPVRSTLLSISTARLSTVQCHNSSINV